MAVPIDRFEPVRNALKSRLARDIRAALQANNVPLGSIPTDPDELLRAFDDGSLSRVQHLVAADVDQLRGYSLTAHEAKFFKTTQEKVGRQGIKLGRGPANLEQQLLDLEQEIFAYGDSVSKKLGNDLRNEFGDVIPLGKIKDADKYRYFQGRYAEIIGLRDVIEEQGAGEEVISRMESSRSKRPYNIFRIDPDDPNGLIQAIYRRINLQVNPDIVDVPGKRPIDAYSVSGNLPKVRSVTNDMNVSTATDGLSFFDQETGRQLTRQAVLDIETAGLEHNQGMWQWSVRFGDEPDPVTLFFKNPNLDRGVSAFEDGRVVPLSEELMPPGTDFASMDDLKGLVRRLVDDDTVLIGHNAGSFDMPYIMADLERLAGTLHDGPGKDPELMALREALGKKIKRGHVFDTMSVMNTLVDRLDLQVDDALKELPNGQTGKLKSLQNMLLQTNMLELLSEREGMTPDKLYEMITETGTHDAGVDTLFTSGLVDNDILSRLERRTSDTLAIPGLNPAKMKHVVSKIVGSEATTAFTGMAPGEIHGPIQELLDRIGFDPAEKPFSRFEQKILLERMRGSDLPDIDLTGKSTDSYRYFHRAGEFKKFVEGQAGTGNIPRLEDLAEAEASIRPSSQEYYEQVQKPLAELNLPHANLSYEERALSAALSRVDTSLSNDTALARHLDGIMPSATWFTHDSVKAFRNSGRVAIPKHILAEAEAKGIFSHADEAGNMVQRTRIASGEELYSLSPFRYGPGGENTNIAKTFRFAEDPIQAKEEASRLYGFLKENQTRFAIDQRTLESLAPMLNGDFDVSSGRGVYQNGIQTGLIRSMDATDNGGWGERAFDALVRFMGGDPQQTARPADLTGPTAFVMDTNDVRTVDQGSKRILVERSGPAVLGGHLEESDIMKLRSETNRANVIFNDEMKGSASLLQRGIATKMEGKAPILYERGAQLWEKHLSKHKPSLGVGLGVAAVGAGYYMYKRRQKKNEYFTDTMAEMPREPDDWYQDYQQEMGGSSSGSGSRAVAHIGSNGYSRMNPMATANVVSNLDRRKIGHTRMGSTPDKYAHLYGG